MSDVLEESERFPLNDVVDSLFDIIDEAHRVAQDVRGYHDFRNLDCEINNTNGQATHVKMSYNNKLEGYTNTLRKLKY